MWIDLADAIKIYARMCRARYGRAGRTLILARAEELRRRGDIEGADVFEQVAHELSVLDRRDSTATATGEPRGQTGADGPTGVGDTTGRKAGPSEATNTRTVSTHPRHNRRRA
jgi:hypothetical protein